MTPPAPLVLPSPDNAPAIASVETGFPATSEGAVAQLASIEVAVIDSASVAGVDSIITAWAAPGGPTASSWSWTTAMASLLDDLGVAATGSPDLTLRARPVMALIKDPAGADVGSDWVVSCVDLAVDITIAGQTSQITIADCQRMIWDGTRWRIAAGAEPVQPPAAPWPSTDASYQAGYRDLTSERAIQVMTR